MSIRSNRLLKWLAAVGLIAAVLVLIYDATVTIRWGGSVDVELTVEAPRPVRSVSYACSWPRTATPCSTSLPAAGGC